MEGYTGRIGRVNLSNQSCSIEPLNYEDAHLFYGGRGLGAKMLFDELQPGIEPLGAGNKIIVMTGPLTGTPVTAANRYVIITKSPQTGLFLDSYAGGWFGPELKFAGFDALVIEGISPHPVYLLVEDGRLIIRPAGHLWGKRAYESETTIKKELGDENTRVAVIGPAGENLANLAIVQNDYFHQAGRGGAGAVFGAKKLKGIAVKGTGGIKINNPARLMAYLAGPVENKFSGSGGGLLGSVADRMKYGTPFTLNITNAIGILPTRNFLYGQYDLAGEIEAEAFRRKVVVADKACYACSMACTKFSRARTGPYKGAEVGGPEYETNALFGANIDNPSLEAIVYLNRLCDDLGLDTVGAGNVVGFTIECYERGVITSRNLGFTLKFGDVAAVAELLEMMAYRKGLGDILAQGVRAAARHFGQNSEIFAMHVKGLEYPAYRPGPVSPGFGLAYAITERGACHRRAWPALAEQQLPPFSTTGRAQLVKMLYDQRIPWHCGVNCDIGVQVPGLGFAEAAEMYAAVTGWEVTPADMQLLADRVATICRCFNLREGATRKDDTLAPRSFIPEEIGPGKGKSLSKDMLDTMLDEYYALRGWDREGVPTGETLAKLSLDSVAGEMEKLGLQARSED